MEKKECKECWLCEHDPWGKNDSCAYWGFHLSHDQRACKQFEQWQEGMTESKYHAYPLGKPMTSISFPSELVTTHDYSNSRHTLKIQTAQVGGVWYAGINYQRQYDSVYGCVCRVSIYDGDFATEQEAIWARMQEILKAETHNRCDEACEFIRSRMIDNRQLSLF